MNGQVSGISAIRGVGGGDGGYYHVQINIGVLLALVIMPV